MRKRYLLGAGIALAMAFSWASAQAQLFVMPSGPGALYFGIEGGWTHLEDAKGNIAGIGVTQRFDEGFNVGARAGYEWGPLRFEEEFNFGENKNTRLSAFGFNTPINGQRNRYGVTLSRPGNARLGIPIRARRRHDGRDRRAGALYR